MTVAAHGPTAASLAELPARVRATAPIVTVVGDLILDRWWRGGSRRLTREAPAPVVDIAERIDAPGGAGNAAMNLAAIGASVRVVGAVGDDAAGDRLVEILAQAGIDVTGVVRSDAVTTVTKTRIMADDQVLVRVDDGESGAVGSPAGEAVAAALDTACDGAQAIVVCDYGSGLLHGAVRERVVSERAAEDRALLVVDAHDLAPWAAADPDVVTPNEAEAALLLRRSGARNGIEGDRVSAVVRESEALMTASGAALVVVTLDRDGTVALRRGGEPFRTRAHPAEEKFASGAGDTFAAVLTAVLASGGAVEEATTLAQHAADVVVSRFGTAVCSSEELERRVARDGPVAIDGDALAAELAAARAAGRRVVFTNGCFDVLHRGHTSYLRQARELGDLLVVAINSDESVRRLKGPERPINGANDRAAVLAALECVDFVTIFETDTPIPLLERFTPDVYVKGGDYTPEMLAEAAVVRASGGEVRIVDYVSSHSTTAVVERIRTRGAGVSS